jgi:hypothetical protein
MAGYSGTPLPVKLGKAQNGGFWVAWPKKASKVPTDMTEDVVREIALPTGLVHPRSAPSTPPGPGCGW